MTSTQLAELTSKRGDSVKRTIETLTEKQLITFTQSVEKSTGGRPSTVYHVNERDSYIVVAQLSPEFTAFLVDEWQRRKAQPALTQEQQVLAIAHQLIETTKQRDEAIKTKAHINDKRTATLMNRASQDSKKIKKLESKLQDEGEYKSVIAAELPQRVDTEFKENVQTWRLLKQISERLGFGVVKVDDPRYGKVNTYHINVIAEFKELYL
ncbi:MAG: hypothetical protein GY776_19910 [Alteromonas sp.]|nr:hypothetical protein [Alteromonas sp.]